MASPFSNSKLTLKLLIDTKNEKVLFGEASKAVVDFLFHILSLPLGTVVELVSKNGMVGSIENVYQSVQVLNEIYMDPEKSKDLLLNPTTAISSTEFCNLFPTIDDINHKPMSTVKDNVTFLVMDDLVIQPLCSAISMITLLNNKINIKDIGALQEMVVELGPDEGIKLLKASLQSKMVLTSVFIKKENIVTCDL